ncbi:hypothetical protein, partial [Photorhabdus antumapuensis]|uniref:hypothetical protein n=1 Tax=Photorhabdus antumapuensis TaxID=2862867 RepID=UPI001CECB901
EGQLLEDALGVLGNAPGTEWLKNLQDRNDVQWNRVKDAYRSWDKKSESLNPVAGAGWRLPLLRSRRVRAWLPGREAALWGRQAPQEQRRARFMGRLMAV